MNGGLTVTRRAALSSIAVGSGLLLADTGAFASVVANRSAGVSTTADGSALLSITGKTAEQTPTFTNRLSTPQTVELISDGEGAEFDVGGTGSGANPVQFYLEPAGTQDVEMSAAVSEIQVRVTSEFEHGSIELTRPFEIPQAGQVDISANVTATGNSGKFDFGMQNEGEFDGEIRAIRIDDVDVEGDTAPTRVEKDVTFKIIDGYDIEGYQEEARPLITSTLDIGASGATEFDEDAEGEVDTVVLPAPGDGETAGPEVEFRLDRFETDDGSKIKMKNATIWITVEFDDNSTRQYELEDV